MAFDKCHRSSVYKHLLVNKINLTHRSKTAGGYVFFFDRAWVQPGQML